MKRSRAPLVACSIAMFAAAAGLVGCSSDDPASRQSVSPAGAASTVEPASADATAEASASPAARATQKDAGSASGDEDGDTSSTSPSTGASTGATSTAKARAEAQQRCSAQKHWTTGADEGGLAMSPSAFYLTRAGRHECFDRVVFDINGPEPVGFSARYVPVVRADGSGFAVPVAGRAALEVIVRAPIVDDGGHQPGRPALSVGDALVSPRTLTGWKSLAAVSYAGSFEGQTTIAVGVHHKRPFRVWTLSRPGYQHVVLDIAH